MTLLFLVRDMEVETDMTAGTVTNEVMEVVISTEAGMTEVTVTPETTGRIFGPRPRGPPDTGTLTSFSRWSSKCTMYNVQRGRFDL